MKMMSSFHKINFLLGGGGEAAFYIVAQGGGAQAEYNGHAEIKRQWLEFREVKITGICGVEF